MKKEEINNHSIEEIENEYWVEYEYETGLIAKCYELRKKKIKELTVGNIRMLLGQNIGNAILIPLAIEILKDNILVEGDFFPGDLLLNTINSDKDYWIKNNDNFTEIKEILEINKDILDKADLSVEIKESIKNAIDGF